MRTRRKGFTLIELLIVIAVISILIGIALPQFKSMIDEGNIARAKGELRTLQAAIESYYIHKNNVYPPTLHDLTLTTTQPVVISEIPLDPFSKTGSQYQYLLGGTNNKFYIVYSAGPAGNGSASISADGTPKVNESNGESCIYVSNIGQDKQP